MPSTHSYRTQKNGPIQRNDVCFARIRDTDYAEIIIEDKKLYHDKEVVNAFLDDMKEFFDYTWLYNNEKNEYSIVCSNIPKGNVRVLFYMFIRCIWEGHYGQQTQDHFYKVLTVYDKYKKYYKKRNRLELFLVACNWFVYHTRKVKHMYNSNHFPIDRTKMCRLNIDGLDRAMRYGVNSFMGYKDHITTEEDFSNIKTKKEYCDFYNFIKQHV